MNRTEARKIKDCKIREIIKMIVKGCNSDEIVAKYGKEIYNYMKANSKNFKCLKFELKEKEGE